MALRGRAAEEEIMERAHYRPLPMARMKARATCHPPGAHAPKTVKADSPAIEAMTDLRQAPTATIRADAPSPKRIRQ
jgi:hypothetical protein